MLTTWLYRGSNRTLQNIIKALCANTVGKYELAGSLNFQDDLSCSRKRSRDLESRTELPSKRSQSRSLFANYLKRVYDTAYLPADEKYNLSSVKYFINLVCMEKSVFLDRVDKEFTHHAIYGDVDKIISSQSSSIFDITNVAQEVDGRIPRLVLIEGAPGVGKTTFSLELCRQWSSGTLLTQYTVVILIKLRDRNIQVTTFVDLLKCISEDCPLPSQSTLYEEVNKEDGKRVLFILEGLDELPTSFREDKNSVFMKLIRGRLLPSCTVIVTTRPWASGSIPTEGRSRIDQYIEIVGFTKENIFSFIDSVIEEGMRRSVYDYVNSNPHILSAMYNPLCAHIVLCVYMEYSQERGHSIPHTMTELYLSYTNIILNGHIPSTDCSRRELEFNNLPQSLQKDFDCICQLAYEGIMKQDQELVFHVETSKTFQTLGLMRCVQPLYRSVTKFYQPSYHFIHFTLQEFMAAVYVSKRSTKDIIIMFETIHHARYATVLRFLAGLTKLQGSMLQCILPSPTTTARYRNVPLNSIHTILTHTKLFCNVFFTPRQLSWLYESQKRELFLPYKDQIVAFTTRSAKTPQEYFELGYCIAACSAIINLEVAKSDTTLFDGTFHRMLIAGLRSVTGLCNLHYLSFQYVYHHYLYNERETLQLLITELCRNRVSIKNVPETSPSNSKCDAIHFPSIPTLKEIELVNSSIWRISELKSLHKLTVTSNQLRERDEIQPNICEFINSHKILEKLVIKFPETVAGMDCNTSSYSFNTDQLPFASISSFFHQHQKVYISQYLYPCVHAVKLQNSHIDRNHFATLISNCTSLKELCIYDVDIGRTDLKNSLFLAISDAMPVICFNLKNVTFNYAASACKNEDLPSINFIANVIENKICSLITIELGLESSLKEKDVIVLMEAMCKNISIKKLCIYIDDATNGPKELIEVNDLELTTELTTEQMTQSDIKFQSVTDVLQFCSIRACHLGYESSLAVGKMLRENNSLAFFEMVYLTLDNEPHYIYPILEALTYNTTLTTLLLHKVPHNIPSSRTLTSAPDSKQNDTIVYNLMTENRVLEVLEVSLYPHHYPSLLKGLQANKVIEELYLPREHALDIIECSWYFENKYRIQFTDY